MEMFQRSSEYQYLYFFFYIWTGSSSFIRKNFIYSIILQQNNFLFKFYIWILKFCQNQSDLDWGVANLQFRNYVQVLKTRFVFEKYEPNQKTVINKIILILQKYRKIRFKLTYLLQRYKILEKMYVCLILYDIDLFEKYEYYKNVCQQNKLIFNFYLNRCTGWKVGLCITCYFWILISLITGTCLQYSSDSR